MNEKTYRLNKGKERAKKIFYLNFVIIHFSLQLELINLLFFIDSKVRRMRFCPLISMARPYEGLIHLPPLYDGGTSTQITARYNSNDTR